MLASCKNCAHQRAGSCNIERTPRRGDILCKKYQMTPEFKQELVDLAMADINREITAAILKVRLDRVDNFAG